MRCMHFSVEKLGELTGFNKFFTVSIPYKSSICTGMYNQDLMLTFEHPIQDITVGDVRRFVMHTFYTNLD